MYSARAYAKINLRLKVVGRRSDGYHLLSMLNSQVDLYDELRLITTERASIDLIVLPEKSSIEVSSLSNNNDNLVYRAAQLFMASSKFARGVSFELIKHIPLQSGLGGGSSDAASALKLLSECLGQSSNSKTEQYLAEKALVLGADVPYFLKGGLARVSGIGEQIERLSNKRIRGCECILLLPAFGLSTPKIFQRLRDLTSSQIFAPDFKLADLKDEPDWAQIVPLIENDLLPAIIAEAPQIGEILSLLGSEGDLIAGVSGSGSALFVLPKKALKFEPGIEVRLKQLLSAFKLSVKFVHLI